MVALRRLMLVPAVLLLSAGMLCAQITKELTKENELVLSTPAWKLVFNGFDYDELYNLDLDPGEMQNLARQPEHAERLRDMMRRIWRTVRATNDQALLNTHYYPMRFATVGPAEP